MCDQNAVISGSCTNYCRDNTCELGTTKIDYPVRYTKGGLSEPEENNRYCIITDSRCAWYMIESTKEIKKDVTKITGKLPPRNDNNNKNNNNNNNQNKNQVQKQLSTNNQKTQPKTQQPTTQQKVPTQPKPNQQTTQQANKQTQPVANKNTANNNNNNNNNNVVQNNKATGSAQNGVQNGATQAQNNVNPSAIGNTNTGTNVGTNVGTNAGDTSVIGNGNNESINAEDISDNSKNGGSNNSQKSSDNFVVGEDGNVIDNSPGVNDNAKQIGNGNNNDNGVSPIVIGSLSFLFIVIALVGFIFIKKRKNSEKSEDVDPIYRNSNFIATPIIEKNNSQKSNRSYANRTAISSNNDGDFDIIISPIKAVVTDRNTGTSQRESGPISDYADVNAVSGSATGYDSIFVENSSSILHRGEINVSTTENFMSESNLNGLTTTCMNTTSLIAPTGFQTNIDSTNAVVPTTIGSDVNSNIIQPPAPAATNQNITIQNASFSYDINDLSTHDPSVSFINSTNSISFINGKDESYMISPIMNQSTSNIITTDMIGDNSFSGDIKQILPTQQSTRGKKTLSMVISEYKENTIYNAKFNYEPSMDDEMKIRINDRVLVKEIFNDGWAYGENITSESLGIFPINRLDSSSY